MGANKLCQTLVPGLLQPALGFAAGFAAEPQLICSVVGKGCHNIMAGHYNGSSGSFRKERDVITGCFKGFKSYSLIVSSLSFAFLA